MKFERDNLDEKIPAVSSFEKIKAEFGLGMYGNSVLPYRDGVLDADDNAY